MPTIRLEAVDTLFFRDGRPFNSGEMGQIEAEGSFPPAPSSVVGSVRASLARGKGWSRGSWDQEVKAVLGDGEDLGLLRYEGPLLMLDEVPLFPTPLHLLGKRSSEKPNSWVNFSHLILGPELRTDSGMMRLPVYASGSDATSSLKNTYLNLSGISKVLNGNVPHSSEVIHQDSLWCSEGRVGIKRDIKTRTTGENAVFQSSHVRPHLKLSLCEKVAGLPSDWKFESPSPLGGEGRFVSVKVAQEFPFPSCPSLVANDKKIHYTVSLITPGDIRDESWFKMGKQLANLPGVIVTACIGKPLRIGGWDSTQMKPQPLRSLLPTGSTWFVEADASEKGNIEKVHRGHIGERTDWGFGQILIGIWR